VLFDSIQKVEIGDVFNMNTKTIDFLYEKLQIEFTKQQVFSISCPDMPKVFQQTIHSFSFNKEGIIFNYRHYNYHYFQFSFEELKPYLNPKILKVWDK
jgi:hypothetical protein